MLNLLKPPGMTSHDAVAVVRKMLGTRRVGHAGTLDPGAAGVLPIAVGKATRLIQWIDGDKTYRAEMTLGIETDTLDAAGKTTAMKTDFYIPVARFVDEMLMFIGHVMQTPPMVSAVRVRGERLYKAARRGETVERPARAVRIDDIRVCKVWPDDILELEFGTRVLLEVTCSKGTYIRSLCADLGRRLGCGAHLSFLVRTRSGPFRLEDSVTFEELRRAVEGGRLHEVLLPMEDAVAHLERVDLDQAAAKRLVQGQAIPAGPGQEPGRHARMHGPAGDLLAIARCDLQGGSLVWQPVTVLYGTGKE